MKGYRSMLPGFALGLAATAVLADPIGGEVDAINTLAATYVTTLDIVGASGIANEVVVSGTINNNDERGWDLTVTSANAGKLQKGAGGAGRELVYNNITFVGTGGTLGTGLTNPSNTTRNVATGAGAGDVIGTTHFFTHTQFTGTGTATSATTDYTFELRITAPANTSLLSGTYTDTITLTLSNDS